MVTIRNVIRDDLTKIVEIENRCFRKGEAATEQAMSARIDTIPDSFFIAEVAGHIVGFVNGPVINQKFITDDLFIQVVKNPATGGYQSILGLAVLPEYQNRGIAGLLLSHLKMDAKKRNRKTITLTCKEKYISFYEKHDYVNAGLSASQLGGVLWYNMEKKLD